MSKSELTVGSPRLGWLVDGLVDTPDTAVTLEDDGKQIVMRVPWRDHGGPFERWFSGKGVHWGDDPDKTKHLYSPPEILWFQDNESVVALVDCHSAGYHSNLRGIGVGIIRIRYAVLDTLGADYRKINGFRSEMPGLGDWMGIRSLTTKHELDAEGRLSSMALSLKSPDKVRISQRLNLSIRPNFRVSRPSVYDATTIHESLQIETNVKRPCAWRDHIVAHNSVRELVDIAGWYPFGFSSQWAHRTDDPERVLSGDPVGSRWSEVRTYVTRQHLHPAKRLMFLFKYDDIGPGGIRRWLRLREHFARGIDPIVATIEQSETPIEIQLTESSIGLDGIGYQLALDAGLTKTKANDEQYKARLERIVSDAGGSMPFPLTDWLRDSSEAYNGIKHANRYMPDVLTTVNTLKKNQLVFRIWIARKLGVSPSIIDNNLRLDPMNRESTLI